MNIGLSTCTFRHTLQPLLSQMHGLNLLILTQPAAHGRPGCASNVEELQDLTTTS